jgi:hypothetical protein
MQMSHVYQPMMLRAPAVKLIARTIGCRAGVCNRLPKSPRFGRPTGPQWVREIEFDGHRMAARIDNGDVA